MRVGDKDTKLAVKIERHIRDQLCLQKSKAGEIHVNFGLCRRRVLGRGDDPRLRRNDLDLRFIERHAFNPNFITEQGILKFKPLDVFQRRPGRTLRDHGMAKAIHMRGLHRDTPLWVVKHHMFRALGNTDELLDMGKRQRPAVAARPLDQRETLGALRADAFSTRSHCLRASADEIRR